MKASKDLAADQRMANAIRFLSLDAIERAENGHGSMLLYALLHLSGYAGFPIDEIKRFRELGSHTHGHPERNAAIGIEVTTGPLGQGIANAVGMAVAECWLNATFGSDIVDYRTWAIVGDGCLREGVAHEVISLAGHLRLGKLCFLWDDNEMTDDGHTGFAISEDVRARFRAANWQVIDVDCHDIEAASAALELSKRDPRPTMIACRTTIGKGLPRLAGKRGAHGGRVFADDLREAREAAGWTAGPFEIPADIVGLLSDAIPELVSGAPDLEGPTGMKRALAAFTAEDRAGRYVHYGVREHARGAMMNGMAAHGGVVPLGATYLVFSDYMRPALRMAALMDLPVVTVYSHDSIGVGKNGPTHQPVEYLAALRAIPNMAVFRPADGVEAAECWSLALARRNGPSSICCSFQPLPPVRHDDGAVNLSARGAYVLVEADGARTATADALPLPHPGPTEPAPKTSAMPPSSRKIACDVT